MRTGPLTRSAIRAVGPRAVLVEVADARQALALAGWIRSSGTVTGDARARGVLAVEVVPAATTVLVDGLDDTDALVVALEGLDVGALATEPVAAETVVVPVRYDGPDLADVAAAWGCSEDEAVAEHTATTFVSAFCGFAPGFAYLSGLPESRAVPRLATPRSRVPAGSVAIADAWCGVYPTASPGGWRLLGTTDVTLWDQDRASPALLAPGTRVRFEAV